MKIRKGAFKPKNVEELKRNINEYTSKVKKIRLNPDSRKVDMVLTGLMKNKEKHGEVYCPCRMVSGDKEEDEEIICPCVFHRGEIELEGQCRCLLFVENKE